MLEASPSRDLSPAPHAAAALPAEAERAQEEPDGEIEDEQREDEREGVHQGVPETPASQEERELLEASPSRDLSPELGAALPAEAERAQEERDGEIEDEQRADERVIEGAHQGVPEAPASQEERELLEASPSRDLSPAPHAAAALPAEAERAQEEPDGEIEDEQRTDDERVIEGAHQGEAEDGELEQRESPTENHDRDVD